MQGFVLDYDGANDEDARVEWAGTNGGITACTDLAHSYLGTFTKTLYSMDGVEVKTNGDNTK